MKKLLLLPFWILQIFTQAKSFRKNPVIGSRFLNRLGLHVFRLVVAHSIMQMRMGLLSFGIRAEHRKSYHQNGYILVENFLDEQQLESLKSEVYHCEGEVRECIQGDTLTHRIMLEQNNLQRLPRTQAFMRNNYLRKLLKFGSGQNQSPLYYIQTIKNHYVDGAEDPQKNLHSDTFHPTMKSWFFLDNVDGRNGPFTYLPGSHKLTWARIKWEYKKSLEIAKGDDKYSANGSLRATSNDRAAMGLGEPVPFAVPGNTLVIANTFGFHCRGQASEKSTRTEIWTFSRTNPFNPFPGIDHPWVDAVQNRIVDAWRKRCDAKAASKGTQSSWHVVDSRNTIS